ncbi:hypothetical protein O181_057435 [Austropuccinia psidii MF-1]|uniref:NodB homology domain-containing protein n=1 Tax=Austropuccinia psidii MF-1 TaxID=1389203 RepID=A0A9Q3HX02_9BASI|nr:hypothetical protein [Austropuccinia psidii MF-1]
MLYSTIWMILNILNITTAVKIKHLLKRQNGVNIYEQCQNPKSIALTFDDGPTPLSSKLNQILSEKRVLATFFINGNNWECIYNRADELKDRFHNGHLLANHGWSHAHMNSLSRTDKIKEIERVEDAMAKILGVKPRFFRPPYGEYDEELLEILSEKGYKGLVLWSQDSGDSASETPSASQIIENYRSYGEKDLILSHENQVTIEKVAPTIIPILRNKGLSFQTVGKCLNFPSKKDWYRYVSAGARDETWACN